MTLSNAAQEYLAEIASANRLFDQKVDDDERERAARTANSTIPN